jgi:hypothetical protein
MLFQILVEALHDLVRVLGIGCVNQGLKAFQLVSKVAHLPKSQKSYFATVELESVA